MTEKLTLDAALEKERIAEHNSNMTNIAMSIKTLEANRAQAEEAMAKFNKASAELEAELRELATKDRLNASELFNLYSKAQKLRPF